MVQQDNISVNTANSSSQSAQSVHTPSLSSIFCPTTTNNENLIKQYLFKIEAVFDHEGARESFRKFLKKECLNEGKFIVNCFIHYLMKLS